MTLRPGTANVCMALPVELVERLDAAAAVSMCSRSAIARALIRDGLDALERTPFTDAESRIHIHRSNT